MQQPTVIWTALPNGAAFSKQGLDPWWPAWNAVFILSLYASPRLFPAQQVTLAAFPDFLHWAQQEFSFGVQIDDHPPVPAKLSGKPDPGVWGSVVHSATPV